MKRRILLSYQFCFVDLCKNNQISLDQPDLFGDITIRLERMSAHIS